MATRTIERRIDKRILAVAALVVAALAIGVPALVGRSPASEPLSLALGPDDPMASCLAFDVEYLRELPVAFEGTASAVDGETVTLTVDRWFRGGDAGTVTLNAPAGMEALIGGIAFTEGETYLITAVDGAVNYCGYSAVATPEMRSAFETAFSS